MCGEVGKGQAQQAEVHSSGCKAAAARSSLGGLPPRHRLRSENRVPRPDLTKRPVRRPPPPLSPLPFCIPAMLRL